MKKASIKIESCIRGHLMRRRHSDIREAVGLVRFLGKQRRSVSIRWTQPLSSDWLGIISSPPLPFFTPVFGKKASHALLNAVQKYGISTSVSSHAASLTLSTLPSSIKFADNVIKLKPYKQWTMSSRTLIVSSGLLLVFKSPLTAGKISRIILLSDLSSVSLSPFCDSLITLHMKNEIKSFSAYIESKVSLLKALPSLLPVNVTSSWFLRGKTGEKTPLYSIVFSEFISSQSVSIDSNHASLAFDTLFSALNALPGGAGGGPKQILSTTASIEIATNSPIDTTTINSQTTQSSVHGFYHSVDPLNTHRLSVTVSATHKKSLNELLTEDEKTKLKARHLWQVKK